VTVRPRESVSLGPVGWASRWKAVLRVTEHATGWRVSTGPCACTRDGAGGVCKKLLNPANQHEHLALKEIAVESTEGISEIWFCNPFPPWGGHTFGVMVRLMVKSVPGVSPKPRFCPNLDSTGAGRLAASAQSSATHIPLVVARRSFA